LKKKQKQASVLPSLVSPISELLLNVVVALLGKHPPDVNYQSPQVLEGRFEARKVLCGPDVGLKEGGKLLDKFGGGGGDVHQRVAIVAAGERGGAKDVRLNIEVATYDR
jgi:hypothetical protein